MGKAWRGSIGSGASAGRLAGMTWAAPRWRIKRPRWHCPGRRRRAGHQPPRTSRQRVAAAGLALADRWGYDAEGLCCSRRLLGAGINAFTGLARRAYEQRRDLLGRRRYRLEALRHRGGTFSSRRRSLKISAFLKAQAEADWRNSEINRRGNYDIYASGDRRLRLSRFASIGGPPIETPPDYVPRSD